MSGKRWKIAVGLILVGAVVAFYSERFRTSAVKDSPQRRSDTGSEFSADEANGGFELPGVRPSKFLNASASVSYVGTQACEECHQDQHASYLQTAHSRALAEIATDAEPPDGEFTHRPSGRSYKVYRKGEELWHREWISNAAGEELVLGDYPMRYVIGSGQFSRSYLVEDDGFLLESPITWYSSRNEWGISPGYDHPVHAGFGRVADVGCLYCHAGRVEATDGNRFRANLIESSIGCESCHGPGALHVAKYRGQDTADKNTADKNTADKDTADKEVDYSIVHPARLSREQNEAICAHCHLRGDATVVLRGRKTNDFRPGLHTADFRIEYAQEQPDKSMSVVGHIQQMRLSRCYQQSSTLTCTTCHDPHEKPTGKARAAYFRQACLSCHEPEACGLEQTHPDRLDASDNCASCHMPQTPTDIPHFAFTHHRIDIHDTPENAAGVEPLPAASLIPLEDITHLPQIEQDRSHGLAYLEWSDRQASDAAHSRYRARSVRLLESVRKRGLRDGMTDAALARIYWEQGDLNRAIELANLALSGDGPTGASSNALLILGNSYLRMNDQQRAVVALERLVKERRHAEDWVLLGVCQQEMGHLQIAIASLQNAARIDPSRIDIQQMLADLYRLSSDESRAQKHLQRAKFLGSRPGRR